MRLNRVITGSAMLCLVLVADLFGTGPPVGKKEKPKCPITPPATLTARRLKLTRVQLQGIDNGLFFYYLDKEEYPEGKGTYILEALTKRNDLNKDEIFDDPWLPNHKDPWGRPYNYEWPTKKFKNAKKPAVWSNGPNGKNDNGRGDDIGNWQRKNQEEGRRQKENERKKKKQRKKSGQQE